jgi:hypothetical protein
MRALLTETCWRCWAEDGELEGNTGRRISVLDTRLGWGEEMAEGSEEDARGPRSPAEVCTVKLQGM